MFDPTSTTLIRMGRWVPTSERANAHRGPVRRAWPITAVAVAREGAAVSLRTAAPEPSGS
ncbi:hypothetical protein AB0D86_39540 [Streptomyces sp. NPDC048324]|uniref:hypothetical protein n=1 Tax=Streptomyces sp. NPDC048324 TaxID=3157205 RepID=UPI00343E0579